MSSWFESAVARAVVSGHDRAAVRDEGNVVVITLADGAGGTARAGEAADAVMTASMSGGDCCDVIENADAVVSRGGGQTTAVVTAITRTSLVGASVGDSQAWIIGDSVVELTAHQRRKPLVGDGCMPVAFAHGELGTATLLVASDGLFAYARRDDIVRVARQPDLAGAARDLVDLVRLASGEVPDDVTVVLGRARSS
jgi:hypothetical protein